MTLPFNIGIFVSATQGALNRLDWFELGAGSISKTAAFIVMLMVASWGLIALRKRFIFWIVLSVNCILGYFLILTYSRGAFVALVIAFFSFIILSSAVFAFVKVPHDINRQDVSNAIRLFFISIRINDLLFLQDLISVRNPPIRVYHPMPNLYMQ